MIRSPIKKGNKTTFFPFMYASLLMKLTACLRKIYISNFLMLIPILWYNDQVIRIINTLFHSCIMYKCTQGKDRLNMISIIKRCLMYYIKLVRILRYQTMLEIHLKLFMNKFKQNSNLPFILSLMCFFLPEFK